MKNVDLSVAANPSLIEQVVHVRREGRNKTAHDTDSDDDRLAPYYVSKAFLLDELTHLFTFSYPTVRKDLLNQKRTKTDHDYEFFHAKRHAAVSTADDGKSMLSTKSVSGWSQAEGAPTGKSRSSRSVLSPH